MAMTVETAPAEMRGRNIGIVNSMGPLIGSAIAPVLVTQVTSAFSSNCYSFVVCAVPGLITGAAARNPHGSEASSRTEASARARNGGILKVVTGNPLLWLCFIGSFLVSTWVYVFTTFTPLYATHVMHQQATTTGFLMGAVGLGNFVYSVVAVWMSDRVGRRPIMMICAALCAFVPFTFMISWLYDVPILFSAILFLLSAIPAAAICILALVPTELVKPGYAASAIAFASFGAEFLGATFSPAIGGWAADRWGLPAPLAMAGVAAALIVIIALLLPETAPSKTKRAAGDNPI